MVEKKIQEGINREDFSDRLKKEQTGSEKKSEKKESIQSEKIEKDQGKEKKAFGKILKANDVVKEKKAGFKKNVEDLKRLETVEGQIEKLVLIASEEGPMKALKVARALNSNYALDNMHDKLIDEEELNKKLVEKGFIEKL
jgi:protein required for attachment to host cells